jgi:hypothetical protein
VAGGAEHKSPSTASPQAVKQEIGLCTLPGYWQVALTPVVVFPTEERIFPKKKIFGGF